MRKILPVFLGLLLLILFLPASASAHHKEEVLGEATPSAELVFPPVTSGTGFILPDSPFFFLDKTFQQVKLILAFSPQQKARVRAQIAGERMAELRLMLVRENQTAINTVLSELAKETDLAAASLSEAAASGQDVKLLAKELNETIKLQRKILNILASQTRGVLKFQLKAARQALKESKVEVEDELTQEDLENEIEEDLADEIENEVEEASESAKKVESDLVKLEREVSKATAKALNRRQQAIEKAIEKRNDVLIKAEEGLLKAEKTKQEGLLEAQKRASEQAREALKKAQEAASKFKEARKRVTEIKAVPVGGTSGVSNSGSSSSSNSGSSGSDSSGSSNSGSSGSGSSGSGSGNGGDDD